MEPADNTPSSAPRWAGLRTRLISGAVMASLALAALWQGGWLFIVLVVASGVQMIREWDALTLHDGARWKLAGVAYAAVPCASLIWLRGIHAGDDAFAGAKLVLFVILTVSATDIGAYFAGRRIGGPKLAPVISPNKTWAGLGGGIVSAALAGAACAAFTPYPPSLIACLDLGALIAIVSQMGDLFESWLKRRVGAKDSGTLIPGHGGLLDRVDGLAFSLPLFALLLSLPGRGI